MKTRALLLATAAGLVLLAAPALAQQPAPEGQRQDETPTLTTDDVAPVPVQGQPAGAQTVAPGGEDDSKLTPEERADADDAKGKGGSKAPTKKKGPSAAELAWRTQYAQAEAQVRAARQQAQEAELKLTELRNRLSTTGTVADRNQLALDIKEQGDAVRQAQAAADAAEAAFENVKAVGTSKKFKPSAGPSPVTASGTANPTYYADRYAKAQATFDDADRRVKIYQDRVSDVRGRILNNSGSGDQFSGMKLQQELDAALTELDKAQADRAAAETELDAARQEALANGVNVPR